MDNQKPVDNLIQCFNYLDRLLNYILSASDNLNFYTNTYGLEFQLHSLLICSMLMDRD